LESIGLANLFSQIIHAYNCRFDAKDEDHDMGVRISVDAHIIEIVDSNQDIDDAIADGSDEAILGEHLDKFGELEP